MKTASAVRRMARQTATALTALLLAASLAVGAWWGLSLAHAPIAHADYPTGHDNSTNPAHLTAWTHGDPNTGDAPGNGNSNNGYYYLKAYAAGPTVFCEVYTGGSWLIQLEDANKNVLSQLQTTNTGGRVYITNGITNNLYQCRISDTGSQPLKDYAELNSGPTGNTTTSDCGGPGPVVDPNFDEAPMEPAPTKGMPVNGCSNPTTVPYSPGDPRLSPPTAEEYADLGPITNGAVYSFTTHHTGDITAFAFFGHQGTNGTLTITNTNGVVINGTKWGIQTPNPNTLNQEFVGADAGVQPAGTYEIHFSGTANNQEIWALSV